MALKEARQQAGLSQGKLAEISGVNKSMIQFYEQGVKDINKANVNTLLKLCRALGCSLGDIMTDAETLELIEDLKL